MQAAGKKVTERRNFAHWIGKIDPLICQPAPVGVTYSCDKTDAFSSASEGMCHAKTLNLDPSQACCKAQWELEGWEN